MNLQCGDIFGLDMVPMSDCPGAQRKQSAIFFLHNPTVNIHILNSCSALKDGYIYPSYQTNAVHSTIHIQCYILYIFNFDSICIYSCFFLSGKITSARKKLKKESYTHIFICKNKNIEILQINYKIRNVTSPYNRNI